MSEEKPNQSMSTLKVIVVIVIVVALWPVLEIIAGAIAAITTFAIGMGIAFVLFIAIVYPHNLTNNNGEETESGNIEKNIRNWISHVYTKIKEIIGNKRD